MFLSPPSDFPISPVWTILLSVYVANLATAIRGNRWRSQTRPGNMRALIFPVSTVPPRGRGKAIERFCDTWKGYRSGWVQWGVLGTQKDIPEESTGLEPPSRRGPGSPQLTTGIAAPNKYAHDVPCSRLSSHNSRYPPLRQLPTPPTIVGSPYNPQ